MKKTSTIVASFIAGILFATAASVTFAEDGIAEIKALIRTDLTIKVDGQATQLNNSILSYQGKTYLYLRDFEKFGMQIDWNGQLKEIDITTVTGTTYGSNTPITSINDPYGVPTQPSTNITETITSNADSSTGNIENDTLYEWVNLYSKINRKYTITSGVANGEFVIHFGDKDYISKRDKDFYYDKANDKRYYSQSFLLKFLTSEDLDGLVKFKVNLTEQKVTRI